MNNDKVLFTDKQNNLVNIASWANSLAWATLAIYLLLAALTIFSDRAEYLRIQAALGSFSDSSDYWNMAMRDPLYYFLDIASKFLVRVLEGFIYYVVLKGIALGLYVIVETDANYREKQKQADDIS